MLQEAVHQGPPRAPAFAVLPKLRAGGREDVLHQEAQIDDLPGPDGPQTLAEETVLPGADGHWEAVGNNPAFRAASRRQEKLRSTPCSRNYSSPPGIKIEADAIDVAGEQVLRLATRAATRT